MYEKYLQLRTRKGVKDADVAKATGITRSTFSDWKTGRSQPKAEKLKKIADYFGVDPNYFSDNFDEQEEIIVDKKGRFSIHFRDGKEISEEDKAQLADFIESSLDQYYKLKGIE